MEDTETDTSTSGTEQSATSKIRLKVVDEWDLKDRGDGVELRVFYKNGNSRKASFSDEQLHELITTLERIQASDDRPVSEGEYVR
jgi:hypothetical protein